MHGKTFAAGMICVICTALSTGFQHMDKTLYFLALGDSYTIGEGVLPEERWPVQLVRLLRDKGYPYHDPEIIATTGWRTDQLREALARGTQRKNYDLVSLLIGVNNQYQGKPASGYEPEFEELLKAAIQLAGNDPAKVIVLSIPDYGFTPFGRERQPEISAGIDAYNAVNRQVSQRMHVRYYDITDLTRKGLDDPSLVATDNLHPSGKMYAAWARMIAEDF
jgi:lysophospholipase L1-like esterase